MGACPMTLTINIDVPDLGAGAVLKAAARDAPYGKIAMLADPFGHGFCLVRLNRQGYDALLGD